MDDREHTSLLQAARAIVRAHCLTSILGFEPKSDQFTYLACGHKVFLPRPDGQDAPPVGTRVVCSECVALVWRDTAEEAR